ncbi:MAG: hypothetical protein ACNYPE_18035 [Candidatus Azotimanducaceae bacterium WSBS_2022_MAG_OTU7]
MTPLNDQNGFSRLEEEKSTSAYVSAAENFGYQSLGVEHLDLGKPAGPMDDIAPHRVQPKLGDSDGYSSAVFVDPDTETPVKVLASCLEDGEAPQFPEVTAGEHIQARIRASQGVG